MQKTVCVYYSRVTNTRSRRHILSVLTLSFLGIYDDIIYEEPIPMLIPNSFT